MDKKVIEDFWAKALANTKAPQLAYTDVIAVEIKEKLKQDKDYEVGSNEWDLHPTEGYYLSSKKQISLKHRGNKYKITIEEDE